jgi:hypothetical protein
MIALGLLVAVILLLAAVTGSEGDGVDVETTERFPVGACVLVGGDGGIVEAPCAEPRTGEIVAKVDFPRPCPAGTSAVVLAGEQLSLCLEG